MKPNGIGWKGLENGTTKTDGNPKAPDTKKWHQVFGERSDVSTKKDLEMHKNGTEDDDYVKKNWDKVGEDIAPSGNSSDNRRGVTKHKYQQIFSDPNSSRYKLVEDEFTIGDGESSPALNNSK